MDIKGHAAIVTGGGSGLGAATASELAKAGAKVALIEGAGHYPHAEMPDETVPPILAFVAKHRTA